MSKLDKLEEKCGERISRIAEALGKFIEIDEFPLAAKTVLLEFADAILEEASRNAANGDRK